MGAFLISEMRWFAGNSGADVESSWMCCTGGTHFSNGEARLSTNGIHECDEETVSLLYGDRVKSRSKGEGERGTPQRLPRHTTRARRSSRRAAPPSSPPRTKLLLLLPPSASNRRLDPAPRSRAIHANAEITTDTHAWAAGRPGGGPGGRVEETSPVPPALPPGHPSRPHACAAGFFVLFGRGVI